jgi:L-amino acid N-acyltransferase YncA
MDYRLIELSEEHRRPVINIFNYYVENSFATYFEKSVSYDMFDRFRAAALNYPAYAVVTEEEEVVGFAFMRAYHTADSIRRTAVIGYFIHPDHTGKGLGTRILEKFEHEARERGIDNLLAHISSLNKRSIAFHLRHGFSQCGRFENVGHKRGRDFDDIWVQKRLSRRSK